MNARIQKSSVKLKLSSTLKPQTHWLKRKQKKTKTSPYIVRSELVNLHECFTSQLSSEFRIWIKIRVPFHKISERLIND